MLKLRILSHGNIKPLYKLYYNNLNIEAFRTTISANKLGLNFSTVEKLSELKEANDKQLVKFIAKLLKSLISKTSLCRANVT